MEQSSLTQAPPPTGGSFVESFGRIAVAASLAGLVFVGWTLHAQLSGEPDILQARSIIPRVLSRLTVFAAAGIMSIIIHGAKLRERTLLMAGIAALVAEYALLILPPAAGTEGFVQLSGSSGLDLAGLQLMRLETALLAAVFLGNWLGRGIDSSFGFVALAACAAVGGFWLETNRVPEAIPPGHPLLVLRMPWNAGLLGLAPSLPDVLIFAAFLEGSRRINFHLMSVLLGGLAGYCTGSFLAFEPWPAWPALSQAMCASGVFVACLPEIKCTVWDYARALFLAALLYSAMWGFTVLHGALHPPPEQKFDITHYRGVAGGDFLPQARRGKCGETPFSLCVSAAAVNICAHFHFAYRSDRTFSDAESA